MGKRRLYRWCYCLPTREDREHRILTRDGDACMCLESALAGHGFELAGWFFNYPSKGPDLREIDHDWRPTDIVVVPTRFPIHDIEEGNRRGIPRSFTTLEMQLFGVARPYIEWCSRSRIVLTDRAASISPEIAARQVMEFRQHGSAEYYAYKSSGSREWKRFKRGDALTAAFLVYTEHVWPGGPACLAAFGVGGIETLAWCWLLRTRFSHLLRTTSFAMAEIRGVPPKQPDTLAFVDSLDVKLLGVEPLPAGGPASPRFTSPSESFAAPPA